MIKAAFFDIDGTLVSFDTHKVPESTVSALKTLREKGIKTFVATGRHLAAINNLGDLEFDGYITLNGGICLEGKDKIIYKHSILQEDIKNFIRYQEKDPFPVMVFTEKEMFLNYVNQDVETVLKILRERQGVARHDGVPPQSGCDEDPVDGRAEGQADGNPYLACAKRIDGAGQSHEQPTAHVGGLRAEGRYPAAKFTAS